MQSRLRVMVFISFFYIKRRAKFQTLYFPIKINDKDAFKKKKNQLRCLRGSTTCCNILEGAEVAKESNSPGLAREAENFS